MSKLRLVYPLEGGGAVIELDGKPLRNVRGIRIQCGVDQETRILLELVDVAIDCEIEGQVIDVTDLSSKAKEFSVIKRRKEKAAMRWFRVNGAYGMPAQAMVDADEVLRRACERFKKAMMKDRKETA